MKNILAAVDFSPATERVVATAGELARGLGADLRLIHVAAPEPDFVGYEPDPPELRDTVASEYRQAHRQLQELASGLRDEGVSVKALLIQGATVAKILEEAERAAADLIVLGSRHHGALHRALLGSVSEGVARASHRPVVIVPGPEGEE